jgi:hypothetical protein
MKLHVGHSYHWAWAHPHLGPQQTINLLLGTLLLCENCAFATDVGHAVA